MVTIDLEDAYYSMFLHPGSRGLFGGKLHLSKAAKVKLMEAGLLPDGMDMADGETYVQPKGLPMGFKNSCVIWTKIARVLTNKWRAQGIRLVHLMDDFLVAASTREECAAARDVMLADMLHLASCWDGDVRRRNEVLWVRFKCMTEIGHHSDQWWSRCA